MTKIMTKLKEFGIENKTEINKQYKELIMNNSDVTISNALKEFNSYRQYTNITHEDLFNVSEAISRMAFRNFYQKILRNSRNFNNKKIKDLFEKEYSEMKILNTIKRF